MESPIFGREGELAEVAATLAAARHGFAALVLEGEAGIGKTVVWRQGITAAADRGYRVLSCRAVPTETRLSFSALGDLLAPLEASATAGLPDPQRRALDAALLRADDGGAAPSPRAIGTGLVTLLSVLAGSAPVLVAIDDVQWLDRPSARALEFAFRRLESCAVVVLATRRVGVESSSGLLESGSGPGIGVLRVGPLSLAALYRIIDARLGRKLSRPLLGKIERACGGNPFYALEIARALDSGRSTVAGELPIPTDLSRLVADRLRQLPERTRELLLRVSALAQPTLGLVDPSALGPAEDASVVRVDADGRIEFAHPLFAGAIHAAASRERRCRVHAELAETAANVEERARHLMLSRLREVEDADVADVLHAAAEHALRRGALEVAAELDEQAARLTPAMQLDLRRQRQLRAARHHLKAGDPERARALCEAVLGTAPEGPARADALHVLAGTSMIDRPAVAIRQLEEALACAGDDLVRAAQLETALGAMRASAFDLTGTSRHATRAVELAERAGDSALLAEAIAMREVSRLFRGEVPDERTLERALALEDLDRDVAFQMRPSLNVAGAYAYLGRIDVARVILVSLRDRLIARGEVLELPWTHCLLATTSHAAGDLECAEREATEAERAAALTGREVSRAFALLLRAMIRAARGNAPGTRADATEILALSERMAWPYGSIGARGPLGHLALSEGNPEAAARELEPLVRVVEATGAYEWPLALGVPDMIEALVATGEAARATQLADALAARGRRFDRAWALATSGRCLALLAAARGAFEDALAAAEQALAVHERLPMPFERARTLLVKGQVQRRSGERRAARATLGQAQALFQQLGARLWAQRAVNEIARIGVRRAPEDLTESELRAAELAAQGLTNPEIAARLFMARRTVEANLARAYGKLGIRSRAQLGEALARRDPSSRT